MRWLGHTRKHTHTHTHTHNTHPHNIQPATGQTLCASSTNAPQIFFDCTMCVCARVKREKLLPTTLANKKADSDGESGDCERASKRETDRQTDRTTDRQRIGNKLLSMKFTVF